MNKAGIRIVFIFALFLICNGAEAQVQERSVVHTISFSPQFFQIKPSANYGLVHRGLNLEMAYQRTMETEASHLTYEGSFAFGLNYNRGIGLTWHLTPIDFYKGFRIKKIEKLPVYLGPYSSASYQWQLFPELHSGHMNWMTNYEVGVKGEIGVSLKERKIRLELSSAIASLSSKRKTSPEDYFYDLQLTDFIANAHTDFTLNLPHQVSHFKTSVKLLPKSGKRIEYAYTFEYRSNRLETTDKMMWHALTMRWRLGKIN